MFTQPTPDEIREMLRQHRFLNGPVYRRALARANHLLAKLAKWAASRNKEIAADLSTENK